MVTDVKPKNVRQKSKNMKTKTKQEKKFGD